MVLMIWWPLESPSPDESTLWFWNVHSDIGLKNGVPWSSLFNPMGLPRVVIFPEILDQSDSNEWIHRSFFWTTGGAGDGEQPWHLQGDTRPRRVGLSEFRGRCPSISIDGLSSCLSSWFIIMFNDGKFPLIESYRWFMINRLWSVYHSLYHLFNDGKFPYRWFIDQFLLISLAKFWLDRALRSLMVPHGFTFPTVDGIDGRSMIRSSTRSKKIPSASKSRPFFPLGTWQNHQNPRKITSKSPVNDRIRMDPGFFFCDFLCIVLI